jgi:hypothetical protein
MPTIPQLIAQSEGKVFVRRVFGNTDRPMVSVYAEIYYVILSGKAYRFDGMFGTEKVEASNSLETTEKVVSEFIEVGPYDPTIAHPTTREEFDWSFVSKIQLGFYSDFLRDLAVIGRRISDLIAPLGMNHDHCPGYKRAIQECLPFIMDELRMLLAEVNRKSDL